MPHARHHHPSRRGLMIAMASGVAAGSIATPALAASPHPDAELLSKEAGFLALDANAERARDVVRSLDRIVYERCGYGMDVVPYDVPGLSERVDRARAEIGYAAAESSAEATEDEVFAAAEDLLAIPAVTLDGLRCKARVIKRAGLYGGATGGAQSIVSDLLAMGGQA